MVGAHGWRPQPNPPGVAPIQRPPEQHHIGRSAIAEHPTRQEHPGTVCQRVDNHSDRREQQPIVAVVYGGLSYQRRPVIRNVSNPK